MYDWILEDPIRVRRDGDNYLVVNKQATQFACLRFKGDRLLFNGEDIEQESFFGFLSITEAVDDHEDHDVIFTDWF
jgi:hypothetical protein